MKTFINKKITTKLINILLIITILSGLLPGFVHASTDTANGGDILKPIEELVVFLCDKVMQWLQDSFVSVEPIQEGGNVFNFRYSPATIFAGKIPAFDVNFISPNTDSQGQFDVKKWINANKKDWYESGQTYEKDEFETLGPQDLEENYECFHEYDGVDFGIGTVKGEFNADIYYKIENDYIYIYMFVEAGFFGGDKIYTYYETKVEITSQILTSSDYGNYESTASKLQETIATWYNALRRIALVGLLSVLVYVGIRIVLTSSASDKAKYKSMLTDWLVAICLLFTLHYIMNFTLVVTQKISEIFQPGESDVLLNTLRGNIESGLNGGTEEGWGAVLAEVIMYATLVIYTIIYTVQYIKRVIYMAFYTLIAPLITLTYPLDKIKDGQAQAFSMWTREFIYTSLIQVIHLVIYFVLVSSALDVVTDYPLYAIIVLAFMNKADDVIKKMFGFDKVETVGTLGQAVTGGLVMNAITQLGNFAKGSKSGESGKGGASGQANSSNVRTAQNNPLSGLQGGTTAGGATGGPVTGTPASGGSAPEVGSKPKRNIGKGMTALGKRYWRPVAKGVAKGTLGVLAGGTGAMLGFASGVAQGDLGKAVGGAFGGAAAGSALGNSAVDFVDGIPEAVTGAVNNVKDTWNEGAFGKDFAQSASAARDFKRTSQYRALRSKYGNSLTDEKIRTMLDSGITDPKDMERILDSWESM